MKGGCRIKSGGKQLQNILGSLWQGDNRISWELSLFPARVKKTHQRLAALLLPAGKHKNGKKTEFLPAPSSPQLSPFPVSGQKNISKIIKSNLSVLDNLFHKEFFFPNIQFKPSLAQLSLVLSLVCASVCAMCK